MLQCKSRVAAAALLPQAQHVPVAFPWQVRIHSTQGDEGLFDFLVVSTGFLTDHSVRHAWIGVQAAGTLQADAPPSCLEAEAPHCFAALLCKLRLASLTPPCSCGQSWRRWPAALQRGPTASRRRQGSPATPSLMHTPIWCARQLAIKRSLSSHGWHDLAITIKPALSAQRCTSEHGSLRAGELACQPTLTRLPIGNAPKQGPSFEFQEKQPGGAPFLSSLYGKGGLLLMAWLVQRGGACAPPLTGAPGAMLWSLCTRPARARPIERHV